MIYGYSQVYFGRWFDYNSMLSCWQIDPTDQNVPTAEEVLFASYGGAAYEGDAVVIFKQNDKLYEGHGSHCSCNGLEEQWNPCEVSWEALKLRLSDMKNSWGFLHDHEKNAREAFQVLVEHGLWHKELERVLS